MPSSHLLLLLLLLFLSDSHTTGAEDNTFVFAGFHNANLSVNGEAEITSGGLIRLTTTNSTQQLGHAFYPSPLRPIKNVTKSFSTTFVFAIVPGHAGVSDHGMAFALSPTKDFPGALPSQHLGLFNVTNDCNSTNHVVAVELDTVRSMEFEDIDDNHVGVDVNCLKSVDSAPASYFSGGVTTNMSLISGRPMQVWIEYDGLNTKLNVTISPMGVQKPELPLLSTKVNLSAVVGGGDVYVGFSASTGAATGSHYVLGWSFGLNTKAPELDLSKLPPLPSSSKKSSHVLALALALATAAILVAGVAAFMVRRKKRRKKFDEIMEEQELVGYGPNWISYKELYKATMGFQESNLLGSGGFGKVYKGMLDTNSRTKVAVKRISHDSKQGMREFMAEITTMARLRHRNLVHLLGYCHRHGELLLVYDFMSNGSLDKFLHGKPERRLDWGRRFGVIRGVASGLLYLHEGWEQVVVHRDIKPSNVLLDDEFNARISDFGLARLYDHGGDPTTTRLVGTLGYLAPELTRTGKATTCTDVYAFGAFLLEVACGRRPSEIVQQGPAAVAQLLVEWVAERWKSGEVVEARDRKMGEDYVAAEVELVLKLGVMCLHEVPTARPSMRQVVQILDGEAALPEQTLDSYDVAEDGDSEFFSYFSPLKGNTL